MSIRSLDIPSILYSLTFKKDSPMALNLQQIKEHMKLPKVDSSLCKRVSAYKIALISKSTTNTDFMSSPYIGAHEIRFTDEDRYNFFFTIGIEEEDVKTGLQDVEFIKKHHKVPRETINFTSMVLIEDAHESSLNAKSKESLIIDLAIIMQFRILTSMYSRYFKYIENMSIIKAVYEKLYNYNLNKQYGSNYAVLDHRARMLINNKTHLKHFKKKNIEGIVYLINDMSGALRSMTQLWYKYLLEVKEENERINNTSVIVRGEEGDKIGSVEDQHAKYLQNIQDKIGNKYEFVNETRIELLLELVPRLSKDKVKIVLTHIHEEYLKDPKEISELLRDVIEVCIRFLYINKVLYPPYASRSGLVVTYLKNLFSSSNVKDKNMKKVKMLLVEISKDALGSRNKQTNMSMAIVVAVYIFMIAIV